MKPELSQKIRKQVVGQFGALLEEAWTTIESKMSNAAMDASQAGKDTFKFPLSVKVTIEPCGEEVSIATAISFGTRARISCDAVRVDLHPELPGTR